MPVLGLCVTSLGAGKAQQGEGVVQLAMGMGEGRHGPGAHDPSGRHPLWAEPPLSQCSVTILAFARWEGGLVLREQQGVSCSGDAGQDSSPPFPGLVGPRVFPRMVPPDPKHGGAVSSFHSPTPSH